MLLAVAYTLAGSLTSCTSKTDVTNVIERDTTVKHDTVSFLKYDTTFIHASDIAWAQVQSGVTQTLLKVTANGSADYTAVGGGVIIHSVDSGKTWALQHNNSNEDLYDVQMLGSFGIAVGSITGNGGPVVLTTQNGGVLWSESSLSNVNLFRGVYFFNGQHGFAAATDNTGSVGYIYRSDDGGMTWSPISIPSVQGLYVITFVNSQQGVACGKEGALLVTTDGGNIWTVVNNPGPFGFIRSVSPVTTQIWFIGGGTDDNSNSIFAKSVDGGNTWNLSTAPNVPIYGVTSINVDTTIICGANGLLGRTIDQANSWDIRSFGSAIWYSSAFSDGANGVAVGSNGAIMRATRVR